MGFPRSADGGCFLQLCNFDSSDLSNASEGGALPAARGGSKEHRFEGGLQRLLRWGPRRGRRSPETDLHQPPLQCRPRGTCEGGAGGDAENTTETDTERPICDVRNVLPSHDRFGGDQCVYTPPMESFQAVGSGALKIGSALT